MIHPRLVAPLCLAFLLACAAIPATASGAAPPDSQTPLTPAEAQHAIAVLQDAKQRAQLLATLQAIAKAAPQAPATKSRFPVAPNSLGAQLLVQLSRWSGALFEEIASAGQAITALPHLSGRLLDRLSLPTARAHLLAASLELALVLAAALVAEFLAARAVRGARAVVAARAPVDEPRGPATSPAGGVPPTHRHVHLTSAMRQLRRLPLALARLALGLLPIAAFAAAGNLLSATLIGASFSARLVTLALVNAYVACRGVFSVADMLVAPDNARLRLLRIDTDTARYAVAWVRRITIVAVAGAAFADVALLLGLPAPAHDAFLKLVALVVHLFLVVVVLQSRRAVAARIRTPASGSGGIASLRNWFAGIWHLIAIFYILAVWVVWVGGAKNGFSDFVRLFFATALVLVAARLAAIATLGTLDRMFRIGAGTARHYPGFDDRASRYYPVARAAASAAIAAATAVALLEVWGLDAFRWFAYGHIGARLLSAMMTVAIAAVAAAVVWEAIDAVIERHLARLDALNDRSARLRTLLPMLRMSLLAVIVTVLGLTVLSEIGVNVAPLLAGAGIVGIAVGFGSQKLVQDVITGLFLLVENAIHVGDTVNLSGLSGTVEKLTIRTIWLRAGDGSVNIVPFSSVTTITNMSRGVGNAAVSVTVAYAEDLGRVTETLGEIAAELRHDPPTDGMIKGDIQLFGVDKVSAAGVTVVGQIPCTPAGRSPVQREFNRRLKERFQALGIEIANPA